MKTIDASTAIVGVLKQTAKIGDKNKKGLTRKQNVHEFDFGMMAISGTIYSKLDAAEYDVYLVPRKK